MIKLASGSAVPADCRLNEGQIDVDQSAMTGESLPVSMYKGDKAIMGSSVSRGETEATVEFTGANTVYGKTAKLLAATTEHSNLQKLLIKIVSILVVVCFVLCTTVLIYLIDLTGSVPEAISYAVVLMVASIPMAIEIVTTTTLALGSKELVSHGAIVTRLSAIEDMAGMSILCSDKTGTLTKNVMELQEHTPVYSPGETQYTLLRYAAMAAKWKEEARDALDRLTLGCVDMKSLDAVVQTAYMPFDPIVKRTEGTVIENGSTFKTTKGAPNIILSLCVNSDDGASAASVADQVNEDVRQLGERGIRSLAVAKTNAQGKWIMLGLLTFLDPPREDTAQTIVEAVNYGVAVKMITGDHLLIAKEMAKRLNLGGFILPADNLPMLGSEDKKKPEKLSENYGDQCLSADGFAQVFPEHKYLIVECLREMGYKVGMTGDGVNDAPALKCADVGVAVCGATDAARSAADIVLTTEGLSTIVHGIFCARKIFKRISNFLTYRISATLQLLIFFFIAVFAFHPVKYMPKDWQTIPDFPDKYEWAPYFHMPGEFTANVL
jgi:H+-transporting ATPase